MTTENTTIDQIRKIRHQISKQFNHDPQKIIEYYIEFQKKYQYRLLSTSERKLKIADDIYPFIAEKTNNKK